VDWQTWETRFESFAILRMLPAALAVALVFGAWTPLDYDMRCTKCLLSKQVVEQRLLGIPFLGSSKPESLMRSGGSSKRRRTGFVPSGRHRKMAALTREPLRP